ncbi:MAG: 3-methyl-2-oxobutanoate hydroxymethyltransferase [Nitrospinae bacterium]|nr:3-methyl-2-oxobutanoate hydroxymethyltransferase [Nitrospinota bacterium]
MENTKVTIIDIQRMKSQKKKITALTAYDYPFAKLLDEAGVDIILVGDSLGMTVLGYENTLSVTIEDMIYHTKAVKRGVKRALLMADMPFMSYQVSIDEALENAGRLVKEGGAEAVKLEGGIVMQDTVAALVDVGIPVMGHVGLTPQSIHKFGGYKVQGRKQAQAREIVEDAKALEDAGAFSVLLEGIPLELAKEITNTLKIPTIGIGAGAFCDGQIMVIHDIIGLSGEFKPKFVKQYVDIGEIVKNAVKEYMKDVSDGSFPREDHSYFMEKSHLRPVQKKQ